MLDNFLGRLIDRGSPVLWWLVGVTGVVCLWRLPVLSSAGNGAVELVTAVALVAAAIMGCGMGTAITVGRLWNVAKSTILSPDPIDIVEKRVAGLNSRENALLRKLAGERYGTRLNQSPELTMLRELGLVEVAPSNEFGEVDQLFEALHQPRFRLTSDARTAIKRLAERMK